MKWLITFLSSSIGQKLQMSLTGIFLILFLTVHLIGNIQLIYNDDGQAFNVYADFMGHNPLIQLIAKGNYFFILLHAVVGIYLWMQNRSAAGGANRYAVGKANGSYSSRNMAWFGIIIFVFLIVHLYQFWLQSKLPIDYTNMEMITYPGMDYEVKDLYKIVQATFQNVFFVIFYVIAMAVVGLHLSHGFQSAFQTLGLNHKKYTPFIKGLGTAYSVLVPLGFAIIPLWILAKHLFNLN